MIFIIYSFFISFMVDVRGGVMRGRRYFGIRIIIFLNRVFMLIRVICRFIKKDKFIYFIFIGEGEVLVVRIIEMGFVVIKFLG